MGSLSQFGPARLNRLPVLLLIVGISGCAALNQQPLPATDRAALVAGISNWTLQGRLALSNGREGGSGKLTWQQRPQQTDLQFVGALGRGSWRLQVAGGLAKLETAQAGLLQAADVETLVRDQLGWEIPVDSMRYWVLGTLDPERQGSDSFDRHGRLLRLHQAGWTVEYDGWIEVEGLLLPRKITASQDRNRVRILVRNWSVSS